MKHKYPVSAGADSRSVNEHIDKDDYRIIFLFSQLSQAEKRFFILYAVDSLKEQSMLFSALALPNEVIP